MCAYAGLPPFQHCLCHAKLIGYTFGGNLKNCRVLFHHPFLQSLLYFLLCFHLTVQILKAKLE